MKRFLGRLALIAMAGVLTCLVLFAPSTVRAEGEVEQAAKDAVDYVYIDQKTVSSSDDEYIAVALSNADARIASATLSIDPDNGGETVELDASNLSDNGALFTLQGAATGSYTLSQMTYTLSGSDVSYTVDLASGEEPYRFEVTDGTEASLQSTDSSADADPSAVSVYAMDSNGDMQEQTSIQSALASADGGANAASDASLASNLVIAIDAGHGGADGGTSFYGMKESDINASIARYLQAELQTYANVSAIMLDRVDELNERVAQAKRVGASLYVSIHINSAGPAATGFEIYVPNSSSYNYGAHVVGKDVGERVANQLQKLGLYRRGVIEKNYPSGSSQSTYADGSTADYYKVIRQARKQGITGVLIEHAFLSNPNDANFLRSEANRRALGVADATGIATHYGLRKIEEVAPAGGAIVYRVYNPNSGLHHLTTSAYERDDLVGRGWNSEGVSFYASASATGTPVYRVYNPNDGNHHFTASRYEYDSLVRAGWNGEGIAWYQSDKATKDVYRLYNPNSGEHHYTTSRYEYDSVVASGWHGEGVAWKSL